jgi:hypothetical protein
MTYIIEDDFDFYGSLKNAISEEANLSNDDKQCMISHEPLTYNSITLSCCHSFNYMPLYNELCMNKKSEVICPYCRTVQKKLIPFVPLPGVSKVHFVNHPAKLCMKSQNCSWLMKVGANKGKHCGKNGVEDVQGVHCAFHKQKLKTLKTKVVVWTDEMEKINKTKTVVQLKALLRAAGLTITGVKKTLIERLVNSKK